jgi:hypothetical protein
MVSARLVCSGSRLSAMLCKHARLVQSRELLRKQVLVNDSSLSMGLFFYLSFTVDCKSSFAAL